MCHQDFQALPAKPTTLAGTFRPTAMAWWYAMIHDDVRTELQNRIVDLSQWIWVICTWMISYLMNRVSFVDSSATNGPMEFDSTIAMPQDISHQSNIGPATDLMCKIYTIYIYRYLYGNIWQQQTWQILQRSLRARKCVLILSSTFKRSKPPLSGLCHPLSTSFKSVCHHDTQDTASLTKWWQNSWLIHKPSIIFPKKKISIIQ